MRICGEDIMTLKGRLLFAVVMIADGNLILKEDGPKQRWCWEITRNYIYFKSNEQDEKNTIRLINIVP
jgi:hypothetical protein